MSRPKGFKLTELHRQRIAKSLRGNLNCLGLHWKWNQKSKENRSKQWKGKSWGTYRWVKGQTAWNKGKKMPKSMSEKMSIFASGRIGEKAPGWRGGISFDPYSSEFNEIRKDEIRQRDNFTCQLCGINQKNRKLSIHHIDYNKKNSNSNNLITLCCSCNFRVNYKRSYYTQYFTYKLNKELGSVLSL